MVSTRLYSQLCFDCRQKGLCANCTAKSNEFTAPCIILRAVMTQQVTDKRLPPSGCKALLNDCRVVCDVEVFTALKVLLYLTVKKNPPKQLRSILSYYSCSTSRTSSLQPVRSECTLVLPKLANIPQMSTLLN